MMKNFKWRAAALAGALAFLSAGAVFAQDAEGEAVAEQSAGSEGLDVAGGKLKIGAYVNSGLRFEVYDNTTKSKGGSKDSSGTTEYEYVTVDKYDSGLSAYGKDADKNLGRVQVDLGWTSGSGNYGINTRFRAQDENLIPVSNDGKDGDASLYLPYAYGWWKPVSLLKLDGGLVANGVFDTEGDIADDVGGGLGTNVHLLIAGLDAAVGFYAAPTGELDNFYKSADNAVLFAGVSYSFKNYVTLKGSTKFQSPAGTGDGSFAGALFSVSTGAIPGLNLVFEGSVFNPKRVKKSDGVSVFNTSKKAAFYGDLLASYDINDKLNAGILLYFYQNKYTKKYDDDESFSAYQVANGDPWLIDFTFQPFVSYAINKTVKPGLGATFGFGGYTNETYNTPGAQYPKPDTKYSGFICDINPFVDFEFGPGRIEFGYDYIHYQQSTTREEYKTGTNSTTLEYKNTNNYDTHRIYLDFLFKY